MWRIVWCSGLVFSISIATMAYSAVECDLLQSFLTMWPVLQDGRSAMNRIIVLGLSDPQNGGITGFRISTIIHLNIQRRKSNDLLFYSAGSNENHWARKITIDGSTHQLLLSVEYCGNFVSSTEALPSVKEIHYYGL